MSKLPQEYFVISLDMLIVCHTELIYPVRTSLSKESLNNLKFDSCNIFSVRPSCLCMINVFPLSILTFVAP